MQETKRLSSTPGLGRSLGGGHGNPLQYSCLENPMDRGAWWATKGCKELDTTEVTHVHIHVDICGIYFSGIPEPIKNLCIQS